MVHGAEPLYGFPRPCVALGSPPVSFLCQMSDNGCRRVDVGRIERVAEGGAHVGPVDIQPLDPARFVLAVQAHTSLPDEGDEELQMVRLDYIRLVTRAEPVEGELACRFE